MENRKNIDRIRESNGDAVGTGVVPVRRCVTAAGELGIEWIVVEQDRLRNLTAWETATVSYLNLKEWGLV